MASVTNKSDSDRDYNPDEDDNTKKSGKEEN